MELQKSYAKQFDLLREKNKTLNLYKIYGDLILVEKIEIPELKTSSGIIVANTGQRVNGTYENALSFTQVLDLGEGYYEGEEEIALDLEIGNILLVGDLSTQWFATFHNLKDYRPNTIGLVRESQVQMRFQSKTSLESSFDTLNG